MTDYDENKKENKMQMKNSSHSYDMNSPRPRQKHTKYIMSGYDDGYRHTKSNT